MQVRPTSATGTGSERRSLCSAVCPSVCPLTYLQLISCCRRSKLGLWIWRRQLLGSSPLVNGNGPSATELLAAYTTLSRCRLLLGWQGHAELQQAGQQSSLATFGTRMEAEEGEGYAIFQPVYHDLKLQQVPQVRHSSRQLGSAAVKAMPHHWKPFMGSPSESICSWV